MFKLVIITDGGFPFGRASANYIRNLAKGLKSEFHVEIFLPYRIINKKDSNDSCSLIGEYENIEYTYFTIINQNKWIAFRILSRIIGYLKLFIFLIRKLNRHNYSHVLKYKPNLLTNLIILLICKIKRVKLITIIPEFYSRPNNNLLRLVIWLDFYLGIRFLSRYSDGIIVFSHFLKDYLLHNNCKCPIIITPNIIDFEEFEISEPKSFKEGLITIGATGTSIHKDGLFILLRSFALVHRTQTNTHLLIIGDSYNSNSFLPILEKEIKLLKLENAVSLLGLVDYYKIPSLLHSCDILALTRPKGKFADAGFPTKLGEYMSVKKPVVISEVGDVKKYFKDKDIVVLVEAENIEDVTKAILRLVSDINLRISFGKAGYEWMKNNLHYKMVASNIKWFLTKD